MKDFQELTFRGQVRRLRQLAQLAIQSYGLDAKLTFINHGENTTFRVDVPTNNATANTDFVPNRYLLRLHRPGYQNTQTINSELMWLAALRQAGLVVPEPLPSLQGSVLVKVAAPGVASRQCSLLRWIVGRKRNRALRLAHLEALGCLTARLHAHTTHWQPPSGFSRRHWDWDGLFGDDAGFNSSAQEVWALLPPAYYQPFLTIANQLKHVMDAWGKNPDVFGLIHADLCTDNLLFAKGKARAIDFDDCGFGYWVYDLAVSLCHWREAQAWPKIRDALLNGYAQVRPLPERQLLHLDLFMAARHVSEILWAVDLAQVNPSFRQGLPEWLDCAARHVNGFLDRNQ